MHIFFLDDDHNRRNKFKQNSIGHQVMFATSADEAFKILADNTFDIIYLDHDLATEHYSGEYGIEKTGLDVAIELKNHRHLHQALVFVHSLNPDGRQNIKSVLNGFFQVYLPEDLNASMLWQIDVAEILNRVDSIRRRVL
jgi:DNA-binding NarL/FixJ family response regulator